MDTELKESFKKEIEILESEGFKYHDTMEENGYTYFRFIDKDCHCVAFNKPIEDNIVCWEIGSLLYNNQLDVDLSGCDDKSYFHEVVGDWFDI